MNSKEKKYENMTPLEALEWIDAYSDDDVYHNITNEVNIIKKALSRLEQLENERQEVEARLSGKETNTFDEISTMIKKANGYDVLVDKCKQLEKENQKLRKAVKSWNENGGNLIRENTKLKQAIEILKENLYIEFKHDNGYLMVIFKEDKEQECDYTIMFLDNKEEYELLKEVLEDE